MEKPARPVEILCERVGTGSYPRIEGATVVAAGCCGSLVWLSPSSEGLGTAYRCLPCAGLPRGLDRDSLAAFSRRQGADLLRISPDALADIRDAAGRRGSEHASRYLAGLDLGWAAIR